MKIFAILLGLVALCGAWDSEQLEVFDVVEEVKDNFYEMLNITKDAEASQVRSAFRRLSVLWHPDKNPNEDTSEKFRNLVSVYEVLKDSKKRAYYDEVLVNGLPNWKSAMYYYRRVRKLGFVEGFAIVLVLMTFIQYICSWAAYFEKLYILEQLKKPKKHKKGAATVPSLETEELPKPSVLNTLPFQIPYLIYCLIKAVPSAVFFFKEKVAESLKDASEESEEETVQEVKTRRRKPAFEIPEGPNFETTKTTRVNDSEGKATPAPVISGGLWTDDDLDELVQLVKKHPGGTPKRWEVIAECIGRSVSEVTYMANKLKNNVKAPSQEEEPLVEEKVKQKTKGGKLGGAVDESNWLQEQQRALEDALAKYPKGSTDRWDRIAELVPHKTKEECMLRFKHLVEVIRKQKQQ